MRDATEAEIKEIKEKLLTLKENQCRAVYSGDKEFDFWNSEDGRLLIAPDVRAALSNYYVIDKVVKNRIHIKDVSFYPPARRIIVVDHVSDYVFSKTIDKVIQNSPIVYTSKV